MSKFEELISHLNKLDTEKINPATTNIDKLSSNEIAKIINYEDKKVAEVVEKSIPQIAQAAEIYFETYNNNRRIFYIGAGTSGRLGVLDAAECPPTFGADPEQIIGLISGGYDTLVLSQEGVEDNSQAAIEDLKSHNITINDFVIGIAASSRTPYTITGLKYAQSIKARTAFIICNEPDKDFLNDQVINNLDVLIALPVGPEVITGSTRMKSGTAQKMTLNMISTTAMIIAGKTFGNLMVDLQAKSDKLAARSRKILIDLFKINYTQADKLLSESCGNVKIAVVMSLLGCTKAEAQNKLEINSGKIHKLL